MNYITQNPPMVTLTYILPTSDVAGCVPVTNFMAYKFLDFAPMPDGWMVHYSRSYTLLASNANVK